MRLMMISRRKKLGISQQVAAERAGMTRANYAHIERGRHEPSIEQMESIAKALGIKRPEVNFFKNCCDETYQKDTTDRGPAA
jgi:Predicted transcriptional regulators